MREIIQFFSHHPILSIVWISLLAVVLRTTFMALTSKVRLITSIEATRLINTEDAVVVDLRPREDFRKGHIIGAINLLPTEIKANNVINELNKHKTLPIIVVDNTGLQAHKPATALNKCGFKKVFILQEGIYGWKGDNLPLVSGGVTSKCNK